MVNTELLKCNSDAEQKKEHVSSRRTQAERREHSEKKILLAAMELIAEKGAYAVTLAEIGEKAGFSRGLPAHKYGSKSNLLKALAKHISTNFSVFSNKNAKSTLGIRRLESLAAGYLQRNDNDWLPSKALIMLTTEARLLDNDLSEYMANYNLQVLSYLRKNIEIAIEKKELKADCNVSEVALFLLSIFRGATLLRINDPNIDLHGLYPQVLFYLDNIRTEPVHKTKMSDDSESQTDCSLI